MFRRYQNLSVKNLEEFITTEPYGCVHMLNTLTRKKQMFNEDEIDFIEETAVKDLASVNNKLESIVSDMARLGKNLSDLKIVQSRLMSIVEAIQDDRDEENCNKRCC